MMALRNSYRLVLVSTILLNALLIVLLNQEILLTDNVDDIKPFLPILGIVVLLSSGFAILSIKILEENAKKAVEVRLLKTHLDQMEDVIKAAQAQKHEFSRHLQTTQAMLRLNEIDKAVEYIEGVGDNTSFLDKIIHIDHPALMALLNSKSKKAEAMGIIFAFSIKCSVTGISIPPWDLCTMLGNLLDNALDAASQTKENPRAAMEIMYENQHYVIHVLNNGRRIPDKVKDNLFKAGVTTKQSNEHGYGLYLVKKLIEQYGGRIDLSPGVLTKFSVYLPDANK